MDDIVKFNAVESKIITIRGQQVILDSDVAELYGVETKRINEAVKNNPEKFPDGYIVHLSEKEHTKLVENFDRFNMLKHASVTSKAFTEKGLYMLATILKSAKATQTTIAIVETYAKIRELSRTVAELSESPEKFKQKSLMQKSGDIIADLLGDDMKISDTETSIELNFAVLKFKHTVKKKQNK
ncbi:MAG: ORF6N domain-containing protein [Bacteroidales bacterium]|jgi:hypothetical protein|nr:ORF6N domain-containing protein [Bacteroidales bacterium]